MTHSPSTLRVIMIDVVTRELDNPDNPPVIKTINFLNRSDRQWLAGHAWHCMHNRKSLTTYPRI